jgi:hypothetical protein
MCLVPLTEKIHPFDAQESAHFAAQLKEIIRHQSLTLAVVVDAGDLYHQYREAFELQGIPTFSSIEDLFAILRHCAWVEY